MKMLLVIVAATGMLLPGNKSKSERDHSKQKECVALQTISDAGRHSTRINVFSPVIDSAYALMIDYPEVYKDIVAKFKNIQRLSFYTERKMLFISFISSDGKKTSRVYNQDGKMKYCITNLALDLPPSKAAMVKAEYPSLSIFYCKEIKMNSKTIYQVILHNSDEYRVINIENDAMEEVQVIKKTRLL